MVKTVACGVGWNPDINRLYWRSPKMKACGGKDLRIPESTGLWTKGERWYDCVRVPLWRL
ncbi:hypothetical protein [Xenorhabdus sp. SGI246]|uniref:hypothetical protein n=1 Tax=Xenorhabdus sp. SGI246 TaxID=3158263 RepID=UPI00349F74B0